jgi:ferredoxin
MANTDNSVAADCTGLPDFIEHAVSAAASRMTNLISGSYYGEKGSGSAGPAKPDLSDPATNSALVKRVAAMFGSSLTGICTTEENWFRSPSALEEMGFEDDSVQAVVMAIAMDDHAFRKPPTLAVGRSTRMGYMGMAIAAGCVAEFIRNLGFRAVPHGNGCALSPPMAEKAGLGEVGYNCMIVTKEFGPCVRLCKVFTDMNLEPDNPRDIGVRETCATCRRCVESCPVDAIVEVSEEKQVYEGVSLEGHWRVDGDRCRSYWREIGTSCGICIAKCPFVEHATSNT